MAGIAGIRGTSASRGAVEEMLESIAHRGPDTRKIDDSKDFCGGVCASKLSAARGDGFAHDGNVSVLFDGDIYNEREKGRSDSDVALEMYRRYARNFAAHLEGVFACAVFDGDNVIIARDDVGVRPLYFGHTDDGSFVFASEMKALVGRSVDVRELLPATTYSTLTGKASYIPVHPQIRMGDSLEEATQTLRDLMMQSVQRRIEDGAVGACLLSGGLDSSIIACAVHELGLRDMPLITVGMKDAPDLENAKIVAEHLGMEHRVVNFNTEDVKKKVPKAVYMLESFDEDCVSGTIANLTASGDASTITNCILSGEGGDELFGGYHLLKDLDSEAEQLQMMQQLIDIAYNTAVQRLDRAMFGNSINYRTPFIDTDVVTFALQIPVGWKIRDTGGEEDVEKFILREAFKDLLPEAIYKRRKLRFSAGTGTDNEMDGVADKYYDDIAAFDEDDRETEGGYTLNSPKEKWYYSIFKDKFPDLCFEKLVGRWDPNK